MAWSFETLVYERSDLAEICLASRVLLNEAEFFLFRLFFCFV